jgi:signal transduction histidine kinase
MRKYLGDILLEKGYINGADLDRALTFQSARIQGESTATGWVTEFLLDVARKKYNHREDYFLGKILTELKLLPEAQIAEALEIQRHSPLEKPRDRLEVLNQVVRRINGSYSLIDLLSQILVLAAELGEAESASLIVHDSAKDALVILMPTGPLAERVKDLEIPRDRGIVGWVYRTGTPVICNDTAADLRFYPGIDATVGYSSRQIICVPLTVKGRKLGALEVINKAPLSGEPGGFTSADLSLLDMFSSQAAVAIENTRLTVAMARAGEDFAVQKDRALAAARSAAGLRVARSVLHDMRRSLVPLLGYAGRMGEVRPDLRVQKYGETIDREMERLIRGAEDAVRFFRDGWSAGLQSLGARELLADMESVTRVESRLAGITVRTAAPEDLQLRADRDLLMRVLLILFRNSREAMPDGGRFTVEAVGAGGSAVVRIADSGPGLTVSAEERLFEPFFSEGKPHAAGLGLAMARRMMEAQGGSIRAVEGRGPGAQFTLTVPLA